MYGEWAIKLKHRLQFKFVGIMFISLLGGLFSMSLAEAIYFGRILGISPEEAELTFPEYSPYFNTLFIIVSIFLFLLLSRRVIKRIEEMNKNVERITVGKMTGLAEDKSKDELGGLSRNINAMAEMIQESLQKEKNMICNMAHDLRTPITSITGYVELLEKNNNLSNQEKEYIDIIYRKSNELSVQVNDLLEYSVLQYRKKEYFMEEISLSSLLEQVIIDFIPYLEKEKMTFLL
jgi:signal transduction histidine kinase